MFKRDRQQGTGDMKQETVKWGGTSTGDVKEVSKDEKQGQKNTMVM